MEGVTNDLYLTRAHQAKRQELYGLLLDLTQIKCEEEQGNTKLHEMLKKHTLSSEMKQSQEYLDCLELQEERLKDRYANLKMEQQAAQDRLLVYRGVLEAEVVPTSLDRDDNLDIQIINYELHLRGVDVEGQSVDGLGTGEYSDCSHVVKIDGKVYDMGDTKERRNMQNVIGQKYVRKGE